MPKPVVMSTQCNWDLDGSQHPSLTGPIRLPANERVEVEPAQLDYLLTLRGVIQVDAPAPAPEPARTPIEPKAAPVAPRDKEA